MFLNIVILYERSKLIMPVLVPRHWPLDIRTTTLLSSNFQTFINKNIYTDSETLGYNL